MVKKLNILSLFDGMSCGQQAFSKLNTKPENYFSSEVDKYAMQVTRYNYPKTKFIGSVTDITIKKIDNNTILLNNSHTINIENLILIGGSPCQGFSFAGKRKGASTKCDIDITTLEQYLKLKEEKFEFNGQSYLFWEYIRILRELQKINPNIKFFLENVKMTKKWKSTFDSAVGTEPIEINSALVSAQNRKRLYWTNINNGKIEQPKDKGILLKDIIQYGYTDRNKSYCIDANYFKGGNLKQYFEKSRRQLIFSQPIPENLIIKKGFELRTPKYKNSLCKHIADVDLSGNDSIKRVYDDNGKSLSLTTMQDGHRQPKVLCGAIRGRYLVDGVKKDGSVGTSNAGKTNCLTTVQKDNNIIHINSKIDTFKECVRKNIAREYPLIIKSQKMIHQCKCTSGWQDNKVGISKSPTVRAGNSFILGLDKNLVVRKLSVVECERLQTVNDNYTAKGLKENLIEVKISNTQRYKMIGNGWTVDVAAHFFKHLI